MHNNLSSELRKLERSKRKLIQTRVNEAVHRSIHAKAKRLGTTAAKCVEAVLNKAFSKKQGA